MIVMKLSLIDDTHANESKSELPPDICAPAFLGGIQQIC
jgi:hypothetical protein